MSCQHENIQPFGLFLTYCWHCPSWILTSVCSSACLVHCLPLTCPVFAFARARILSSAPTDVLTRASPERANPRKARKAADQWGGCKRGGRQNSGSQNTLVAFVKAQRWFRCRCTNSFTAQIASFHQYYFPSSYVLSNRWFMQIKARNSHTIDSLCSSQLVKWCIMLISGDKQSSCTEPINSICGHSYEWWRRLIDGGMR